MLSHYYKHSHYTSFLRSLCYYNFVRVMGTGDQCEYSHRVFNRSRPASVYEIQRKPSTSSKQARGRAGAGASAGGAYAQMQGGGDDAPQGGLLSHLLPPVPASSSSSSSAAPAEQLQQQAQARLERQMQMHAVQAQ